MDKWGQFFPGVKSLDELIEQLQQKQAQMQSMLDSMSGEQRRELMDLMQSLVQDPGLRNELAMLARTSKSCGRWTTCAAATRSAAKTRSTSSRPCRSCRTCRRWIASSVRCAKRSTRPIRRRSIARCWSASWARSQRSARSARPDHQLLEEAGLVERNGDQLELTPRAIRKIGQKALKDIFQHLARDRFGNHEADHRGRGGDRTDDTKAYEFGDPFLLDLRATLQNSLVRNGAGTPVAWRRRTSRSIAPSR